VLTLKNGYIRRANERIVIRLGKDSFSRHKGAVLEVVLQVSLSSFFIQNVIKQKMNNHHRNLFDHTFTESFVHQVFLFKLNKK